MNRSNNTPPFPSGQFEGCLRSLRTTAHTLSVLLLFFVVLHLKAQSPEQTAPVLETLPVRFQVLDAHTGISIAGASVFGQWVENDPPTSLKTLGSTGPDGRFNKKLPPGQYAYEIDVPGYQRWRAVVLLGLGHAQMSQVELFPVKERPEVVQAQSSIHPGYFVIYGFTLESSTDQPISGVDVEFKEIGITTRSNENGFYSASIPVKSRDEITDADTITVSARKKGFANSLIHNVELSENDAMGLPIKLATGEGQKVETPTQRGHGTAEDGAESPEEAPSAPIVRVSKSLRN